jgi:ribosomal subunit interface protein
MIERLEIHGVHFTVDNNLKKYITKKVNKLEKYVTSEARESFRVEVFMEEVKSRGGKQCECEAVMHLPKEIIRVKDGTINMYAAIDIVEEKLRQALKRHKEQHDISKKERHLTSRSRSEV